MDALDMHITAMTAAGLADGEIVQLAAVRVRQQHADLEIDMETKRLRLARLRFLNGRLHEGSGDVTLVRFPPTIEHEDEGG